MMAVSYEVGATGRIAILQSQAAAQTAALRKEVFNARLKSTCQYGFAPGTRRLLQTG
jgi:hypothetical protein